jgi:hypothetical protein
MICSCLIEPSEKDGVYLHRQAENLQRYVISRSSRSCCASTIQRSASTTHLKNSEFRTMQQILGNLTSSRRSAWDRSHLHTPILPVDCSPERSRPNITPSGAVRPSALRREACPSIYPRERRPLVVDHRCSAWPRQSGTFGCGSGTSSPAGRKTLFLAQLLVCSTRGRSRTQWRSLKSGLAASWLVKRSLVFRYLMRSYLPDLFLVDIVPSTSLLQTWPQ